MAQGKAERGIKTYPEGIFIPYQWGSAYSYIGSIWYRGSQRCRLDFLYASNIYRLPQVVPAGYPGSTAYGQAGPWFAKYGMLSGYFWQHQLYLCSRKPSR